MCTGSTACRTMPEIQPHQQATPHEHQSDGHFAPASLKNPLQTGYKRGFTDSKED
jgi:hypothetical protein